MEGKSINSQFYFTYYQLNYRERLRFYDENIKNNALISYEEKAEISIDNAYALFEIGKYEKFLYVVDELIEMVVEDNIYQHHGEDVFQKLLFRKAAAHYHLSEFEAATSILEQLVKINERNELFKWLLKKVKNKTELSRNQKIHGVLVLMFIFSFVLYLLDIFIVSPFFPLYHDSVLTIVVTVFLLALVPTLRYIAAMIWD